MSQAELARAADVARSTVARAARGPLAGAVLASGKLDASHPNVAAWVEARGGTVPVPELADDPGDDGDEYRRLQIERLAEDVRRLRLANAEREGDLIPREPIRVFVLAHFDATQRRLLRDFPQTIAQTTSAMVRSGEDLEAITATIRDHIGAQLRSLKAQVTRSLREAEKG